MVDTFDKAVMREDRVADVEIHRSGPINLDLLKAQFLVSGSYFEKADSGLNSFSSDSKSRPSDKIEYLLLKGKILSKTSNYSEAMSLYNQAIDKGKKMPEHYSAEAALMAGILAHDNNKYDEAYDYYKLCQSIDCDNNIYREVIRKNAKTQLRKLRHLYPQP